MTNESFATPSVRITAPRQTNHRSYVLVRRVLDSNQIPHFVQYGAHDNVLVTIGARLIPVVTCRPIVPGTINSDLLGQLSPAYISSAKRAHGVVFAVDPDLSIVEVIVRAESVVTRVVDLNWAGHEPVVRRTVEQVWCTVPLDYLWQNHYSNDR